MVGLIGGHAAVPRHAFEKAYAARLVDQRVPQPAFRARVTLGCDRTCCVCALKHAELLDVALNIEDGDIGDDPWSPMA